MEKLGKKKLIMALGLVILVLVFAYYYIVGLRYQYTDDAYIKAGMAGITAEITGKVTKIVVNNNQQVKKDDILVEIEDIIYQANYEQALADLQNAQNNIVNFQALYKEKLDELDKAGTQLDYTQAQYNRYNQLNKNNIIAKEDFDLAKNNWVQATQNVTQLKEEVIQQLASLDGNADLKTNEYSIYKKAKAEVDKAKFYLDNTKIKAPFDGVVANFYLQEGSFVNPNKILFTIIKQDDVWVEADFKETQLGAMKPGQIAVITIDSFPNEKFNAVVDSITLATGSEFAILPAQNSSGNWVKVTQRIMVRLKITDKITESLSSGMSTGVTIDTYSSKIINAKN